MNTLSKQSEKACPVCVFPNLKFFFEILDVPVYYHFLWSEQQTARNCSRGDIKLAFCPHCGFITNTVFDPTRLHYTQDYENSLDYSPRFQSYAQSLAAQLIKRHNLHVFYILALFTIWSRCMYDKGFKAFFNKQSRHY